MTTSKFEWTASAIFLSGVIIAVSGFKYSFTLEFDFIALLAFLVAIYAAVRTHLNHLQQIRPYLNFLYRVDARVGTVSFYVQNVGGGFAKINKAYLRFNDGCGNYYDYFPLIQKRHSQTITQLLQKKPKSDIFLKKLLRYADNARPNKEYLLEQDLTFTVDSYEFTGNEAIGKDEKVSILTFQHDFLKANSGHEQLTNSLVAHLDMLELFIEFQDVDENKHYLPSKEAFKLSEAESLVEDDELNDSFIKMKVRVNVNLPKELTK